MGKIRLLIILYIVYSYSIGYKNIASAGQWEVLGGGELSDEGEDTEYFGIGMIKPLKENWWFLGRVFGLHVNYKYELDDNTLVGELSSVTPSVGVRHSLSWCTLTLFTGLDLEKVGQETQEGDWNDDQKMGVSVQGEWDKWWEEDKNLSLILNYKSIDNFYWGRLRGKKEIIKIGDGSIFLGLETVGMGSDDFNAFQVGGVTEGVNFVSDLSIGLKVGYRHSSSLHDTIYGGVEFYYSF